MKKIDRFIANLSCDESVALSAFLTFSVVLAGATSLLFFPVVFISLIILGLASWMISLGYRFYKS